jgi:signal transduction histidine kinase
LNIYEQKRRWKWILFIVAVIIVTASLWYTNILVQKISRDERQKLSFWADAIQRKAHFVGYTENFFLKIKVEEQKRVRQLALATQKLVSSEPNADLTFYGEIIDDNTTIPVILTDDQQNIIGARNIDFDRDTVKKFEGKIKEPFTKYPPVLIHYYPNNTNYFYYSDSRLFTELRVVLNDLIENFFAEVVLNSASVPVIITDSSRRHVIAFGNLDSLQMKDTAKVAKLIAHMETENTPIELQLENIGKNYIFYQSSFLLTQLRYYPLFQLGIIAIFLFISYMLFSTARRSEQNQVWVGMAKETAHQLGTPISSIMAWLELMRMQNMDQQTVTELDKDVRRLGTIAERFSKIGSAPSLKEDNIVRIIYDTVEYLKPRTSRKVNFSINLPVNHDVIVPVNAGLFEWVIENLCKNSIDAMSGSGDIAINIAEEGSNVVIDLTDSGKGISRANFKTIFQPGYTSKKRGWGLGLTLAKRIISEYHKGKIFVRSSVINEGTTIRIVLKKKL